VSTWISIAALIATVVIAALQIQLDSSQGELARDQRDLQAQQSNIAEESELSHIFEQIGVAQRANLAAERQKGLNATVTADSTRDAKSTHQLLLGPIRLANHR
jgi:ABC-type uncharacterized transport system ATPase subunit